MSSNEISKSQSEANPSITPSKAKSTNWLITLNNPTTEEIDAWRNVKLNHYVKEAQGQLEMGEEGTPHIQGYLRTESVRFTQIKKLFPRAHIEIAKNALAAKQYCVKKDTRLQDLPQTEINTSIHRAVYLQTIKWFQANWTNGDRVIVRDKPKEFEIARANMLADASLLSDETREWIYDKAVSSIIRSGVKHIEFIAVNQITRLAFIKYFPALIYRENGWYEKEQEQANSTPQTQSDA